MKTCNRCNKEFSLSEFPKNHRMPDGRLKQCKSCKKIADKKWCDENQEYMTKRKREWLINNREKKRAHATVYKKLISGKLVKQPCEICGKVKVDAHHDDYKKRVDVRWLCRKHHLEIHRGMT